MSPRIIKIRKVVQTTGVLASLCLPCLAAHAMTPSQSRAVWFWQSPHSPNGSVNIVGDSTREDETIARLKSFGMTTLYGSYATKDTPVMLRAWNRKLAANGIVSYLLLSRTNDLFPESWPLASEAINSSFIQFNREAALAERFAGLAFDIEAHIFTGSSAHAGWNAADGLTRRQYMADFLQFFQRTRKLLDDRHEQHALIEATLPVWYAKVSGSIQWSNALDRDDWFAQLAEACDRLSIMAFEIASPNTILERSKDETDHLKGRARIALRANQGKEWQSPLQFWQAVASVEQSTAQGVEIQDYALLCDLPARP